MQLPLFRCQTYSAAFQATVIEFRRVEVDAMIIVEAEEALFTRAREF